MNTTWIDENGDRLTRDDVTFLAFWGRYPTLVTYLRDLHGYEMGGYHYPANGFSKAEFCQWANALDEATFASLTGGTQA
jgi:hypothetical protein